MNDLHITNARIVTRDAVFSGDLLTRDGDIVEVAPAQHASKAAQAIDFHGDFLIPGLIELHTDNLEIAARPRPKVHWPAAPAVVAHDAQMAACGVTTVYDAVAVGDIRRRGNRLDLLHEMIDAVTAAQKAKMLRADHHLHLRCELSHPTLLELVEPLSHHPLLGLMSLMDHTPGQRQFVELDQFKTYYQGKYSMSDTELDDFIVARKEDQRLYADKNRKGVIALAKARNIQLASHDDAIPEHVDEAVEAGVAIAEFPTTLKAAAAARAAGLHILLGAPNVVRGKSHSGNAAAVDFARAGLLDILSSDYVPVALLHAAFKLETEAGMSLPDAVATVTANPAAGAGLADRGRLSPGLRADLVRVSVIEGLPVARATWRQGERIA
jgi:alpha-D-ribose 1-methylphosphonate 5-triphosphate diphosphatase